MTETLEATTNERFSCCGGIGLRDSDERWHKITITGYRDRIVHAVTSCGVVVDIPISRVYKADRLTPIRPKHLKGVAK